MSETKEYLYDQAVEKNRDLIRRMVYLNLIYRMIYILELKDVIKKLKMKLKKEILRIKK